MTAFLSRLAWAVVVTLMLGPCSLDAQTLPPPRLDASGTVGWFGHDREVRESQGYDDDTEHRWVFGGDVGWYWTEHLKSEIGISATTTGSSFVLVPVAAPALRDYPYASGRRRGRETRIVTQQFYQFGHNAWVHPYVGAGVAVLWETSRIELDEPPFAFPGLPVPPPARAERAIRVKPVVSAGLKAYISPRAYFRGDILISPWRVVLQPRGRVTEPARALPIAALQLIEPERDGGSNQLVKAVAIGVATGAATFFTMLMIAFATLD